jgi:hypothetical protein
VNYYEMSKYTGLNENDNAISGRIDCRLMCGEKYKSVDKLKKNLLIISDQVILSRFSGIRTKTVKIIIVNNPNKAEAKNAAR